MSSGNYSVAKGIAHRPGISRLAQALIRCKLYVLFHRKALRASDRRRVAPHKRSEGAKMAELHYMEMGWSGSGWMDPLPMENTPAPTPASTPFVYDDFGEPGDPARAARPGERSAKKSSQEDRRRSPRHERSPQRSRAKKAARKSAKKRAERVCQEERCGKSAEPPQVSAGRALAAPLPERRPRRVAAGRRR